MGNSYSMQTVCGTGKGVVDFRISGSSSGFGFDPEAKVSTKLKGQSDTAKWTLIFAFKRNSKFSLLNYLEYYSWDSLE